MAERFNVPPPDPDDGALIADKDDSQAREQPSLATGVAVYERPKGKGSAAVVIVTLLLVILATVVGVFLWPAVF